MTPHLRAMLTEMRELPLWYELDFFAAINTTNCDGENALHFAVDRGDLDAARELIAAGVRINQADDRLCLTPLHNACYVGNLELVKLLVEAGADLFALTAGNTPSNLARIMKHDHVCDYLSEEMRRAGEIDPDAYTRSRIEQLRREIERLEKALETPTMPHPAT